MKYFVKISLIIAAIATFLYLFLLGIYATPSADDYGFIAMVNENGILNLVKTMYLTWQPRFSSFFINGIIYKIYGYADSLWLYILSLLTIGYISVFLIIKYLIKIDNIFITIVISILITNIGLMSLFELSTLYWLCTSGYVLRIWITLLLFYIIVNSNSTNIYSSLIIITLFSIYLGGGPENYTPLLIISLFIILAIRLFYNKVQGDTVIDNTNICIILSIVTMFMCFIIVFIGPGNDVRMAAGGNRGYIHDFNMVKFIKDSIIASIVFCIRISSKFWYYICAMCIFMIIGKMYITKTITWRYLCYATCIVCIIIYLSVAISVFGTGWYAPPRAYSYLSFVMLIYSCYIGAALGQRLKNANLPSVLMSFAITITSIIYIFIEVPIVKDYHADVVEIRNNLISLSQTDYVDEYVVEEIKIPIWKNSYSLFRNAFECLLGNSKRYNESYFPYEPLVITKDSNHWRNQGLLKWADGSYKLVGWAEP